MRSGRRQLLQVANDLAHELAAMPPSIRPAIADGSISTPSIARRPEDVPGTRWRRADQADTNGLGMVFSVDIPGMRVSNIPL